MSINNKVKIIKRNRLEDCRGWFLKVINGLEDNLPHSTGEVYVTSAKAGEAKGGHYHPKANEWFTLIVGNCLLKLVDVENNESMELKLSSDDPVTIFVPNNVAHIFENRSNSEFILIAYSDLLYDPADTIPYTSF